jgi:hypothetical protein
MISHACSLAEAEGLGIELHADLASGQPTAIVVTGSHNLTHALRLALLAWRDELAPVGDTYPGLPRPGWCRITPADDYMAEEFGITQCLEPVDPSTGGAVPFVRVDLHPRRCRR